MQGNESFVGVLMELEVPNLGRTERVGGSWRNKRGLNLDSVFLDASQLRHMGCGV
jgi:hypothetical protein